MPPTHDQADRGPITQDARDLRSAVEQFLGRVPQFDGSGHTRLAIGGAPRGWVNAAVLRALRDMPAIFDVRQDAVALRDAGLPAPARSELLQFAAETLRKVGLVPGWRDELYALDDELGIELLRIERAAFRVFGLRSRAVHINGFTRDGWLWIGRRSPAKATDPGKLDNFAAGGLTAGEDPDACVVRELWEEAGVPAALAQAARPAGSRIHSLRAVKRGVHDEILLCYDIELPDGFVPACQDGEVAGFLRLDVLQCVARLAAGEFTWDAGLVLADFLRRY